MERSRQTSGASRSTRLHSFLSSLTRRSQGRSPGNEEAKSAKSSSKSNEERGSSSRLSPLSTRQSPRASLEPLLSAARPRDIPGREKKKSSLRHSTPEKEEMQQSGSLSRFLSSFRRLRIDQKDADRAWPSRKEAYELIATIGEGYKSSVLSALCIPKACPCAIKRIRLDGKETFYRRHLHEGVLSMFLCRHESIVGYHTSFVAGTELWIVMDLIESVSVGDFMNHTVQQKDCTAGALDEATIRTILKPVVQGLVCIHSTGFLHSDIKSQNVLLSTEGEVVICDFGLATECKVPLQGEKPARLPRGGTWGYMAPELLLAQEFIDCKADIYSLGVLALELADGEEPYNCMSPTEARARALRGEVSLSEAKAASYSLKFRDMMERCLRLDPKRRPSAAELLQHSFFKASSRTSASKRFIRKTVSHILQNRRKKDVPSSKEPALCREFTGYWNFHDDSSVAATHDSTETPDANDDGPSTEANLSPDSAGSGTSCELTSRSVACEESLPVKEEQCQKCAISIHWSDGRSSLFAVVTEPKDSAAKIAMDLVKDKRIRPVDFVAMASRLHAWLQASEKKRMSFVLAKSPWECDAPTWDPLTGDASITEFPLLSDQGAQGKLFSFHSEENNKAGSAQSADEDSMRGVACRRGEDPLARGACSQMQAQGSFQDLPLSQAHDQRGLDSLAHRPESPWKGVFYISSGSSCGEEQGPRIITTTAIVHSPFEPEGDLAMEESTEDVGGDGNSEHASME